MAEIVSSGAWDLIGAARPSIADPFLPKKIEEGRYGEIRECIGINTCISKSESGHHLGCTQNATAGEEYRRGWHPERFEAAANADKDVLVVGAGPAGMECAIVLGKRGFRRVHLVEAEAEVGGHFRWVTQLPGLGEWARVVNWRRIQLDKLANVEVITGRRLEAKDVREYGAEIVVVAAGARWSADGVNGLTHDPIPGRRRLARPRPHAGAGHARGQAAAGLARGRLRRRGLLRRPPASPSSWPARGSTSSWSRSTSASRASRDESLEGPLLRQHLHDVGIRQRAGSLLAEIHEGGVRGHDEHGEPFELEADGVVLATQRLSNEALYLELVADEDALRAEEIEAVYRIGDCVAPRVPADAIFDGHRLAREIDSENPAIALPPKRERLVLERAGSRA